MLTTSLIREIQIKIIMRYHIMAIRMAMIKKKNTQGVNAGKGVEKREPSCIVGGNVN